MFALLAAHPDRDRDDPVTDPGWHPVALAGAPAVS
jgi:hypothetical protein